MPLVTYCGLCRQPLDVTKPHAIVNHNWAHLECADEYDSRDLGSIDLPDDFAVEDWEVEQELCDE